MEEFWREQAANLVWEKSPTKVLTWNQPFARWFEDGTLNASVQCLDKNLSEKSDHRAIVWEGEPGDTRTLTYRELYEKTCQLSNALKKLGVQKGDRLAIYMPLVPEAVVAMLACARLGAPHSVIFGGFSSEAIAERINDAQCKIVITADGSFRKGSILPLKINVDEALKKTPSVKNVIVLNRAKNPVTMTAGRDVWWHDVVENESRVYPPEIVESEHLLFLLYTSGTTGKPKGIMHSTAGYLLQTFLTTQIIFGLTDQDLYWCTADVGWITGHSYLVYGPLQTGATLFMYEGAPNFPDYSRFWKMIERHKITVLYTAPTAIRSFMRAGDEFVSKHNLSSLRLLGSVGEPINPEAWRWYSEVIGKNRCPIADTWWQTETGAVLLSPRPKFDQLKPGSCNFPLLHVQPKIVRKDGTECASGESGFLVFEKPWPSMTRGIYKDPERFQKTYWSDFPGRYFTGDGARKDADGYFWILGRVDDVLNVSGHRLSTAEVESALVSHPSVAEAATVGRPDDIKGQGIVAFVVLRASIRESENLAQELKAHVTKEIGALARPDEIRFTEALPKTRSGKIMRRLLRELAAHGKIQGDTSTLEDANLMNKLAATYDDED